jgi:hypothetical protein
MSDDPTKTFGHRCADKLWDAKRFLTSSGLTREDVARLIDEEFAMEQPAFALTSQSGKKERAGFNIPPTPEEVEAYSKKIGWPIDGAAFCDHYERKGWIVDRTRMKNWQAQIRKAKRDGFSYGGPGSTSPAKPKRFPERPPDYTRF